MVWMLPSALQALFGAVIDMRTPYFNGSAHFMLFPDLKRNSLPFRLFAETPDAFLNQTRMIVDFTQVGKNNSFELAVVERLKKLGGVRIGKVAMSSPNPLFEMPGIRPIDKKVCIVVGFDHQRLTTLQSVSDQLCDHSQVGANTQAGALMFNDESHRFLGIVACGEGLNADVANLESGA
jgi:hypothetical protein